MTTLAPATTATAVTGTVGASAAAPAPRAPPDPACRGSSPSSCASRFDTRSGFWLLASIGIIAVLATARRRCCGRPATELTYDSFAAAIGFPMAILLPIVAILSVTSEWSQRSGLTTFTLVPHRGRIDRSPRRIVAVGIGVVSMLVADGDRRGRQRHRHRDRRRPTRSGTSASLTLAYIVAGQRPRAARRLHARRGDPQLARRDRRATSSTRFVLPTADDAAGRRARSGSRDLQPWVDFNFAQGALFDGVVTGAQWAQLGVTGVIWLVIPLTVGLWMVLRSEVK